MSDVIEYLQQKDPRFKDVTSDELVEYVGNKYPDLLQDDGFRREFEGLTRGSRRAYLPMPGAPEYASGQREEAAQQRDRANELLGTIAVPGGGDLERRFVDEAAGDRGQLPGARYQNEEALARADILARQMRAGLAEIEDPIRRRAFEEEMRGKIAETGVFPIEGEKGPWDVATAPLVTAPRVTGQELRTLGVPGGVAEVGAGVQQGIADMAEFFSSPLGIATMGTAGLPRATQQAIAGAFAVDMARQAPGAFAETWRAAKEGRVEDAVRLGIGAGANVFFAKRSGEHALQPGAEPLTIRELNKAAEERGIPKWEEAKTPEDHERLMELANQLTSLREGRGDPRLSVPAAEMLRQVQEGKLERGGGERVRTVRGVPGAEQPREFYRAEGWEPGAGRTAAGETERQPPPGEVQPGGREALTPDTSVVQRLLEQIRDLEAGRPGGGIARPELGELPRPEEQARAPETGEAAPGPAAEPAAAASEPGGGESPYWLTTHGPDERLRLYRAMREIQKRVDRANEAERRLRPGPGEIAAGAAGFDEFLRAEGPAEFLRHLRKGTTPEEAERLAKVYAREMIEKHNRKRPKDINWQRDEGAGDSIIERAAREIRESLEVEPGPGPQAGAREKLTNEHGVVTGTGEKLDVPFPKGTKFKAAVRVIKDPETGRWFSASDAEYQTGNHSEYGSPLTFHGPGYESREQALEREIGRIASHALKAMKGDSYEAVMRKTAPNALAGLRDFALSHGLDELAAGIEREAERRQLKLPGRPGEGKQPKGKAKGQPKGKAKQAPAAAPVETPREAEEKAQEHVTETAQDLGKRPAEEVKAELIARLEKALKIAPNQEQAYNDAIRAAGAKPSGDAKKYAMQKEDIRKGNQIPKITVDIPGDGTFTILNTKEAIGEVLKRARALATRAKEPTAVRRTSVPKVNLEEYREKGAALRTPRGEAPKARAEAPGKVEQKVQEHVTETAEDLGKRPAKEVKAELINQLEVAFGQAPDDLAALVKQEEELNRAIYRTRRTAKRASSLPPGEVDRQEAELVEIRRRIAAAQRADEAGKAGEAKEPATITIDIPGDGKFTIRNTKQTIAEVLKRARALEIAPFKRAADKIKVGEDKTSRNLPGTREEFERLVEGYPDDTRLAQMYLPKEGPRGRGRDFTEMPKGPRGRGRDFTEMPKHSWLTSLARAIGGRDGQERVTIGEARWFFEARERQWKAMEGAANESEPEAPGPSGAAGASYGDYREDRGDLFSLTDEELANLFRGGREAARGAGGADVGAPDFAAREFYFRNYEEFRKWMDARYAEQDLEGMKLAFAEADSKTKVQYIKENRAADPDKKAWLQHIATGSPLPAGRPPIARTTPRPGSRTGTGTGEAGRRGGGEAGQARPHRDVRPMPEAPPRVPPEDPVSRVMGGMEHVKPVEMPEIVRLAKELSGSEINLKKLRRGARGLFNARTGQITLARELFRNPEQAAKTLAHEIGHLWDYLPDRRMDRGNILGRLGTLKKWMLSTFPKGPGHGPPLTGEERQALREQAEKTYPKEPDRAAAEYQRLLGEEINKRGLRVANEVWREAYELSKWWRPFDEARVPEGFLRYRKSSPEVYADAISVLLNAPEQVKARAPQFWEMLFNYLEKKPEVKTAYTELQQLLHRGPEAVRNERLAQSRAKFQTGEEMLLEKIRAKEEARRPGIMGMLRELREGGRSAAVAQLLDQGDELTRRVEKLRKAGIEVPQWKDPRNAWEENLFAENRNVVDLDWVTKNVVQPLEDAGVDISTLGEALKLQRIIGQPAEGPRQENAPEPGARAGTRTVIASPGGLDAKTAHDTLSHLYAKLGPEKAALLEAATKRFRKLFLDRAGEGWRAGIFSDDMWHNTIVPNSDSYAAFRSLDHIDDFVTPMARKALGTLKDIENPFITTLYKLASLNNLIALQRAKIATRDFMKGYFPESWKDVETKWDGQKMAPVKRVAEGMNRMEVLENGKPVAYDVDPYVEAAFRKLTPANVSVFTGLLDKAFRNLVYPLIVKFNPDFQLLRNPRRDFERTARNLGAVSGVGRIQLMKNYVKALRSAKEFVGGRIDPLTEEMLKAHAIGMPMESFGQLRGEDDVFRALMKRYRLGNREERGTVMDKLTWLPRQVAHAGAILEALPKLASYRAIVKEGVMKPTELQGPTRSGKPLVEKRLVREDPRAAAAIVRNYTGTPNYRVKGLHTNVANSLVPFLNIFLQGYRSDFKLATDPKTRGGYWMRWALHDGSKALLMGLAASGALGPALKKIYDGVSEYDKSNYTVVPVGWQEGGDFGRKIVYARIPRDETGRFLSAAVYKATRMLSGDRAARRIPSEMFAVGAGILPSLSPGLRVASAWGQYGQGQNPQDYRGQPVVPEREFKAGGMHSLKPMLQYTLGEMGALKFIGYDPRSESRTEMLVNGAPVVKTLLKVSDYGYHEQQRENQQDEERRKAIGRLDYSQETKALLTEFYRLEKTGDRRTPAQENRYMALGLWHNQIYSPLDELSKSQDESGNKDGARNTRRSVDKASERFEKQEKHEWPKWTPLWK